MDEPLPPIPSSANVRARACTHTYTHFHKEKNTLQEPKFFAQLEQMAKDIHSSLCMEGRIGGCG